MSEFISNVLKLVSGSVIAQILAVLLIPIITRLYTPEDYGLFSLILAIIAIIAIFSSLSYQLAIMLPKEDEDAAHIVALCFVLILFSSIITGLIFFFFAIPIANVLNAPALNQYLWFIPFLVFSTAIFSVLTYWNSRRKRFGVYAVAQVVNSLSTKGIQIGLAIPSTSLFGLIFGYIIGNICGLLIMLKAYHEDISLFKKITLKKIKDMAVRYKKFPLFNSFSTTANLISTQITPIIFAFFFNPTIVGYYAIALHVISMPMQLIGNAIGQVFFQRASEENNKTGNIKNIVTELHRRLLTVWIFPTLLLMILGPQLFLFVFGNAWSESGLYAAILAPWFLLVFITSPLSTLFNVFERLEINLALNALVLISRIMVLLIGGFIGDPIITLILFSLTGVIFVGGSNYYILRIAGVDILKEMKINLLIFIKALLIIIPLIIIKYIKVPTYIVFGFAGFLLILFYYIMMREDPILKNLLLSIVGKR